MERQTEPPINQKKKKGRGEKGENQNTTMACIGIEIKKKKEKKERKTYLKEEEIGNAAVHSSLEKNHGQRKLKMGEKEVSQKK